MSGSPSTAAVLDHAERRSISLRLGLDLAGAGLLGVGALIGWWRPDQAQIAELVKAAAALLVGLPTLARGIRGFASTRPASYTDQLVALAVLAAMAAGAFVTAALVPLFLDVGRLFEERSALGAKAAIEGIRGLRAPTATRVRGGAEERVQPDALQTGDVVIIRPGEIVPADGQVTTGHSSVDQAPVTGESRYEEVGPGDPVFAGTLNLHGMLRVQVGDAGAGTVLGRVVALLQEVEASKTPALRVLEQAFRAWLPIVLTIAATTLFFTEDIDRTITVLIVACPTALVLAGPAAMVAAMSSATRQSILVKNARFLELATEIDTLILDKTGTVTEGVHAVSALRPGPGITEVQLLEAAARCGHGSLHPVSRAVVAAATARGLSFDDADEVTEAPGRGMTATARGQTLRLGREGWFQELGLAVDPHVSAGGSGSWVAAEDTVLGFIALSDRIRPEASDALQALRDQGIERVVLLTGDRQSEADRVAKELGIDDVVADVLPEAKLDIVRREQASGRRVMMVGDGVNDALALSGADVGVAIGAQVNEIALGGADVALMTSDVARLPTMLTLARRTRRTMTFNAVLGVAFSGVMLGLATAGVLSPLMGAVAHNLGAALVVLNSARLLRVEPTTPG